MRNWNVMIEAKPIKCKRCGCDDVAWAKSKKGKWYLVEGGYCHPDLRETGLLMFNKTKYHNCKKNIDREQPNSLNP